MIFIFVFVSIMFVGSIVMTVNATDADDPTTQNGKIEYRLLNGTDVFNINKEGIPSVLYIYSISWLHLFD